jgi:hypothetical protein
MIRSLSTVPEISGAINVEKQTADMRQRISAFQVASGCRRSDVAKILGLSPRVLRKWLETGQGRLTFGHLFKLQGFLKGIRLEKVA